jgi:hypothetical protein
MGGELSPRTAAKLVIVRSTIASHPGRAHSQSNSYTIVAGGASREPCTARRSTGCHFAPVLTLVGFICAGGCVIAEYPWCS